MSDTPPAQATSEQATTCKADAAIVNKRGLHARASAKFVSTVAKFHSDIRVTHAGVTVSGRSIMGLMMLGASIGKTVEIEAEGPDADAALAELLALIAARFQEDE